MTRRGVIGLTAGLAASGMFVGCGSFGSATFRCRLTVDVQTPDGVRSGSSVLEYEVRSSGLLGTLGTQSTGRYTGGIIHGQAVVIDLPDGPIFALLYGTGGSTGDMSEAILNALGGPKITNDDLMIFARKMGARGAHYVAEIRRTVDTHERIPNWPMMVRFRDINDPKSVEQVGPDAIGVRRIWVETTRDPVTTGIEKRFPSWFEDLTRRKARLNGSTSIAIATDKLDDNLSPGSFL